LSEKKHGGGQEEEMAKAIHEYYRRLCKEKGWPVKYDMDYADLPDDIKADNLAAAARIPDVLSHARLTVIPDDYPDNPVRVYYKTSTSAVVHEDRYLENGIDSRILEDNIERLAEAEHKGWMEQKYRSGWAYGTPRNDKSKIHDALIPYKELREEDKEKDRNSVRSYPNIVKIAGCKIVHGKKSL
jgi:hypothetical protein